MRRLIALLLFAASANAAMLPIHYRHRTLANGLEVYSIEDHSTPTVAIEVTYRVGSKDDPPHRSGFAHLFEHLMFKSTAHMKAEMMDRLTEDVGGEANAYTGEDMTIYWEEIPSNYLRPLLWAEGERMASLAVDEADFKSERDVVKAEFQDLAGAPYGMFLGYAIDHDSYAKHPYKRPGIGSIEDLDAATLDDVQAFHCTYYRPDNAVLVVAGDVPKQFDAWVDRYLGSIPKPSTAIPRITMAEPPRPAPKRFDEHGPNVPLPAIAMTWLIPPAASSDAEALQLLSAILGDGDSSRLSQSLVDRQQIAQSVDAQAKFRESTGYILINSTLASGKTLDAAEKALRAEVRNVIDSRVSAAELEKAKNLVMTDALRRRRETNLGKASAIRDAVIYHHDASYANKGLDRLQRVTIADVQRVAKKYLGANPVVITYTAGASK